MDNKNFDTRLKASLENLETPFEASTWAAMEQRLNARTAGPDQSAPVDNAVLRALDGLEVPYVPAHWEMLAQRMADDARRRRRIWFTKLGEAAIFLLFFANLQLFFGRPSDDQNPGAHKPAATVPVAAAPVRKHATQRASETNSEGPTNTMGENTANTGMAISDATTAEFSATNNATTPLLRSLDAIINDGMANTSVQTPAVLAGGATDVQTTAASTASVSLFSAFAPLSNPAIQPIATAFETLTVPVFTNKAPKTNRFYAASFASLDQNTVVDGDYAKKSKGFGGGFALGLRKKKWGVEAGLGYSRKQYIPKKELEIYGGSVAGGYYGSYASEVEADMVSIPVKLTRRVAHLSKVSLHAVAGISANIALEKAYHYRTVFFPGLSPSSQSTGADQQPQLRKKGKGVLENGQLNGNVYASADAGVRVEVPVGNNLTLYAEPTYRQAIAGKGVGPKKASINSVCLQIGVLAGL